jgi:outer membrane protein
MKGQKLAVAVLASWAAILQLHASELRHLTLQQAVQLAISQNRALKIAGLKIAENQQKKVGAHSSYFPVLTNQSNALHITELQQVVIPAGGLGVVSGTLIPGEPVNLNQGKRDDIYQRDDACAANHAAHPHPSTEPDCRRRCCHFAG